MILCLAPAPPVPFALYSAPLNMAVSDCKGSLKNLFKVKSFTEREVQEEQRTHRTTTSTWASGGLLPGCCSPFGLSETLRWSRDEFCCVDDDANGAFSDRSRQRRISRRFALISGLTRYRTLKVYFMNKNRGKMIGLQRIRLNHGRLR